MAKTNVGSGVVEYCKLCGEAAMDIVDGTCTSCR